MGIFSRFEGRMEDGIEGAANKMFDAPISPVQISKKAEKAMRREKMVGAGRQYAPTLYTVLVNPDDDQRLFGYYPTLAGETETYLIAKAQEDGLAMDGQPLVRFIVDDELRRGKFDIIAEMVSAPIIAQLRQEEMDRYGLAAPQQRPRPQQDFGGMRSQAAPVQQAPYAQDAHVPADDPQTRDHGRAAAPADHHQPLPYVPEEEIDRSIDYGEYTFNSQDWDGYNESGQAGSYAATDDARAAYGQRNSQPFGADYAPADQGGYAPGAQGGVTAQASPAYYRGDRPEAAPQVLFVPAQLIDTATNRTYQLDKPRLILGRSSASDVVVDDINASRSHAEIRFDSQGYWAITDLGSTNGTYVNGQRITKVPLNEGDQISAGMTNLVFSLR